MVDRTEDAMADVAAERERQKAAEGWSIQHDDEHQYRELARAGAAYVQHYYERQWLLAQGAPEAYRTDAAPDCWPWDEKWWKPKDSRRDLVRAAALIIAEIERLDRVAKS